MNWFLNLKVSAKLIGGFMIVALLAGFMGVFGLINIRSVDEKYSEMYKDYGIAVGDMGKVAMLFNDNRAVIRDMLLNKDANERQKYIKKIDDNRKIIEENLVEFEKSIISDEARREFENFKNVRTEYVGYLDKIEELAFQNREEEGIALLYGDARSAADEAVKSINTLFVNKEDGGLAKNAELSTQVNNTVNVMIIIMVVAIIFAIALGLGISKNISRVLNTVSNKLSEASRFVASASSQLAGASQQLAESSSEQAAAIEETSATMEETTAMVKQNTENKIGRAHV